MKYRVGIDQLKISMKVTDEDKKHGSLYDESYIPAMEYVGAVKSKKVFDPVPGEKVVFKRGKPPAAWTSARQPLSLGGDFEVWYGRHTGAYRSRIRFNPSRSDVAELGCHFANLADCGFDLLHRQGRVSYVEFFIDVDGAVFSDYLYFAPQLRCSDASKAEAGTMYLGERHSYRRYSVYDKANELQQKHGVVLDEPRLRLEARWKGQAGFAAAELPEVSNPFTGLAVICPQRLQASSDPAARRLLAWLECGYSAQQAYWLLDRHDRTAFRLVLPSIAPDWWAPETMWSHYAEGLGWIDALRRAGRYGEILSSAEKPIEWSGQMLPSFDSPTTATACSSDFASKAIDCLPEVELELA